jgi:proteasome alpha subunit
VSRGFRPGISLADAAKLAVRALGADGGPNAAPRALGVEALEVAILDRGRAMPRKFRRIKGDRLAALLADGQEPASTVAEET